VVWRLPASSPLNFTTAGLSTFLESVAALYEIVVFTAGMEAYACEIIDRLDTRRVIAHRLYRQVFSFSEETSFLFIFFFTCTGVDIAR
jgi:hypothetical protein